MDEKLQKLVNEFNNMTVEEYNELFESVNGYSYKEIPKSNFNRIVEINSCQDCPYLFNRGEYMVSERHVCDKTNQSTSKHKSIMPKHVAIELHEMFENCTFLKKE